MNKHAETKQQVAVTVQNELSNGSYFTISLPCSSRKSFQGTF
jgi:hypothetical protein